MAGMSLVVLAAGIGSRYGGLKQLEPVGPSGEVIVDYSVYDAIRAGFDHVVFVIRPDIEAEFRAGIGSRIEPHIKTSYVHQTLDNLPRGTSPPPGRTKPWGTGHAALVAREAVRGPWAVINADDFYGADSFRVLAGFIEQTRNSEDLYGMVSFILENTLSDHGTVSRGVCMRDAENRLVDVVEYTRIERTPGGILAGQTALTGQEIVSMNMWGFKESFFAYLAEGFSAFLESAGQDAKTEFYLPEAVNRLAKTGRVSVEVLSTSSRWYGVTYAPERDAVIKAVQELVGSGAYPEHLWQGR